MQNLQITKTTTRGACEYTSAQLAAITAHHSFRKRTALTMRDALTGSCPTHGARPARNCKRTAHTRC
eukprot:5974928-Lingulodinium_polyedra.AAC.1